MPATEKRDHWPIIDAVIAVSRRVLLFGLPGTGKTHVASKRNVPKDTKVYQVTMTDETPAAEIRGHFIPKGDEMIWMDGPGIRAWREGARLVINEIDRASSDALSFMYVLLDDPEFAELTLPTGEVVRPADGFHVVATMNGAPYDLPLALQDRFPVTIEVIDVNPEAIAALPPDLQVAARESALVADAGRRLSIRQWAEFASLRPKLNSKFRSKTKGTEMAAQAVFGDRWREALKAITFNEFEESESA